MWFELTSPKVVARANLQRPTVSFPDLAEVGAVTCGTEQKH